MKATVTFFFLFLLLFGRYTVAQSSPEDTTLVTVAAAQFEKQYSAIYPVHAHLFNGPEYVDYSKRYFKNTGHQFFGVPEKQDGSIYYNNQYFTGLQFTYDVVLQQIVLLHPTTPLYLRLINERVNYFTLAGHHFKRIVVDSLSSKVFNTGFYEVLVDGKVELLANRSKQMLEKIENRNINAEFVVTDKLFLKKDNVYHTVNKKNSVLKILYDRNEELKKFSSSKKLKFKKASRESSIIQLVEYYRSLAAK
ncbi:hypothetical protein [Hymenobacter volaticus]|uniref:Uncharacterized protein n=1 Tax=Hymenobacter volaticus TaxID=2932254 RepID=A0ABY4G6U3_9BACT|nr:hypothetical protein [Hymenobacter volaticus]UOQ66608.1 hypothetical protein MUN86_01360 [Hymenobacter volaticus]